MYKPFFTITDDILSRIAQIESMKGAIKTFRILPEREAFIRKRATVEATHSSTSIEGNPLTLKQVEKTLVSTRKFTKEQYAEIEVKNYKKSLDWISKRKLEKKPLSIDDLLKLHGIITDSLLDETRSGKLRFNPVYIVNQKGETVYDGPSEEIVESELDDLFKWLNSENNTVHPVIVAGVLHYMIASIHPFADGNGRTARAIVSLYLSLVNYDFRESLVLDSYYAVDRPAYYKALGSAQNGDYEHAKSGDLTIWLDYFTEGFLSSVRTLMMELEVLTVVQKDFTPKRLTREESDIISYVVEFGSIDLAEAMDVLPHLSRRSVQRKLSELVSNGYLVVEGDGPATRYVAAG